MEILAPAGSREALERADAAGADAVYLGYSSFSARAGAGNFNEEELAEAIRYAHLRHMRVHVTVNTLVKDAELPEALRVLRMLRRTGADAVLIQDAGLLRLARKHCPEMTVHASTQMAIHNRTGAEWCRRMGIGRVVLARECSLEEIRKCRSVPVEIEVFCHGAQCVAVSGLCLFSSMAGERSGNRGRCAQPCRKQYFYDGRKGAWLSPRDVCTRDDLPALAEAGADSLKVEGRLKRPEYVAVTAGSYARGNALLRAGRFRPADAGEREGLMQIFQRGGFMRGYAFGCEDAAVIEPGHTDHLGVPVGRVERVHGGLAEASLEKELRNGDGLTIRGRRGEADLIYAGPDREPGGRAVLRLRPGTSAAAGDRVWRLTSAVQMAEADALPGRTVPADMALRAVPGEPLRLRVSDGENTVEAEGSAVEKAKSRPAEERELAERLGKTGGTVFRPRNMTVETADAFVPVSALNALRREALDALAEARIHAFEPPWTGTEAGGEPAADDLSAREPVEMPVTVTVRTEEQAEAVRRHGFRVVHAPEDYREEALRRLLERMPAGEWLKVPEVCEEETLRGILDLSEAFREKLGGVVLGTIGQLGCAWPVPWAAGSGVPVMNRQAAELLLEEGCAFVTASQELTGKELEVLTAGRPPIYIRVYGRTQMMLLHHCPARTALGLSEGRRDCALCDRDAPESLRGKTLTDPEGRSFPLLRQRLEEGCLVRLLNLAPTELTEKIRVRAVNAALEMTTETGAETGTVLRALETGRKTGCPATAGHWNRPVL